MKLGLTRVRRNLQVPLSAQTSKENFNVAYNLGNYIVVVPRSRNTPVHMPLH